MTSDKLKEALREAAQEEFFNIDNSETILWEPSEQLNAEMDNLFKQTKKRSLVVLKRTLLVAAVILLISTMTVFSFAQVRNKVINYFKHQNSNYFDVDYGYDEPGDIQADGYIDKIYILKESPEGFNQTAHHVSAHVVTTSWENADGDTIVFQQGDGITTRAIDNERLEKSYIVLEGLTVEAYTEEGFILLLWNTEQYTFSVDYYGAMSAEDLAKAVILNLEIENG